MATVLTPKRGNMPLRRRIEIRVQTFARTAAKAAFYVRHGHWPITAWQKARVTL